MQVNLFTNSKKIRNVPNDPPILALIPYAQKAKRRGANEKKPSRHRTAAMAQEN
ncbi:hypothetical protein PROSTU_00407 [Providencia stuartii ATCC 25827]|uniref:Uncharacterized protein n=1 Tax=Providencia stuartii ATCC 25827 TaxID=471874 RepID=A0AA87CW83_PROST|nr:hypothetical protein PROSTU_00407 [Providencia stuartii ATCC 25827]